MEEGGSYQSVKEAMRELHAATLSARANQPASVHPPPSWSAVHAKAPQSGQLGATRGGESPRPYGIRRTKDLLPSSGGGLTTSVTSSVGDTPGSPASRGLPSRASALGGSNRSGLNHTATYYYGEAPLKPVLCTSNRYSAVGSYSMFGSQAVSDRVSSGAFGFGTSTRDQLMNTYISPAHLKESYGKHSPPPDTYTLQSSLGKQVLDSKTTYPSRSFGVEERFDADRRDRRAIETPGPGAYRV